MNYWYTMPLPRFQRLPAQRRAHILEVAQGHLAEHGPERASYNRIIAAAGISKTSAYLYFDGKDDLVGEVVRGVCDRLESALGAWQLVEREADFRAQLKASSETLRTYLVEHPDELAVMAKFSAGAEIPALDPWIAEMLSNGGELGLVRKDIDPTLLHAVTKSVLRAVDEWVLAAMVDGDERDSEQAWQLLAQLWAPPGRASDTACE